MPRRIGKDRRLQVHGCQPVSDREAEEIDDLLRMRPDKVRTQEALRAFLDECLVPVDRLIQPPGGVPVGHVRRLHPDSQPARPRLRFSEADGGNGRNREWDAWHAPVVWSVSVALEEIPSDDLAVMTRDWRQRRAALCGIAGRVHLRVGHALVEFVQLQPAVFDRNSSDGEPERINRDSQMASSSSWATGSFATRSTSRRRLAVFCR